MWAGAKRPSKRPPGRVMSTALRNRINLQQPVHRTFVIHRYHAIPSRRSRLGVDIQGFILVKQRLNRARGQNNRRWRGLEALSVG